MYEKARSGKDGKVRFFLSQCGTQKEISVGSGLAQGHVSKYLGTLRDAGFVERRVPVMVGESSRHGRYHVIDPYLRFYCRFLADRQAQLAMGEADIALAEIKKHLLDFIAAHTWEELCRVWTLRAGARGLLDVAVDQVGSIWTKQAQVDVVALNSMEKTIILGECKWHTRSVERSVLRQLLDKTAEIVPKQGQWRVVYLGFAREGWTAAAQALANDPGQWQTPPQANWRPVGMKLLTLAQVDQDLAAWTR